MTDPFADHASPLNLDIRVYVIVESLHIVGRDRRLIDYAKVEYRCSIVK